MGLGERIEGKAEARASAKLSLTKDSMAPGSPQLKFGKLAAKLREMRQCRRASVLSAILSRSTCMPEQGRTRGPALRKAVTYAHLARRVAARPYVWMCETSDPLQCDECTTRPDKGGRAGPAGVGRRRRLRLPSLRAPRAERALRAERATRSQKDARRDGDSGASIPMSIGARGE